MKTKLIYVNKEDEAVLSLVDVSQVPRIGERVVINGKLKVITGIEHDYIKGRDYVHFEYSPSREIEITIHEITVILAI